MKVWFLNLIKIERPRRKRTGYPIRIVHLKAVASVTLDPNGNNFPC